MKDYKLKAVYYIFTYLLCVCSAIAILPILKLWHFVLFLLVCAAGLSFSSGAQLSTKNKAKFLGGIFLMIVFIIFVFKFSLQQSSLPQLLLLFLGAIAWSSFIIESSSKLSMIHFESIFLAIFSTCLPLVINPTLQAGLLACSLFLIVFLLQITHIRSTAGEIETQYVVTNINFTRRFIFSLLISAFILAVGLPLFFLVPKLAIKLNIGIKGSSVVDFKNIAGENLNLFIAKNGQNLQLREDAIMPYVRSLFLSPEKQKELIEYETDVWQQPKVIKRKDVKSLPEFLDKGQTGEDGLLKQALGDENTDINKAKGEAIGTEANAKEQEIIRQIKILTARLSQSKSLYKLMSRMGQQNFKQTEDLKDIAKRIENDESKLNELKQKIRQLKDEQKTEAVDSAMTAEDTNSYSEKLKKSDKRFSLAKGKGEEGWGKQGKKGEGKSRDGELREDEGKGKPAKYIQGKTGEGTGEGAGEGMEGAGEDKDGTGEGAGEGREGTGQGKEGTGEGAGEGMERTGKGKDGTGEGAGEGREGTGKGKEGTGEGTGEGKDGTGEGTGRNVYVEGMGKTRQAEAKGQGENNARGESGGSSDADSDGNSDKSSDASSNSSSAASSDDSSGGGSSDRGLGGSSGRESGGSSGGSSGDVSEGSSGDRSGRESGRGSGGDSASEEGSGKEDSGKGTGEGKEGTDEGKDGIGESDGKGERQAGSKSGGRDKGPDASSENNSDAGSDASSNSSSAASSDDSSGGESGYSSSLRSNESSSGESAAGSISDRRDSSQSQKDESVKSSQDVHNVSSENESRADSSNIDAGKLKSQNDKSKEITAKKDISRKTHKKGLEEKILKHKAIPIFIKNNIILLYVFLLITGIFLIIAIFYIGQLGFYGAKKIINDLKLYHLFRTNPNKFIIYMYYNLRFIFSKLGAEIDACLSPKEAAEKINALIPFAIKEELSSITNTFVKARYSNHVADDADSDLSAVSYIKIKNKIAKNTKGAKQLLLKLQMLSLIKNKEWRVNDV